MRFFNFEELESTNDFLKNNAELFQEYDIVTARIQTKGRGRRGKVWFANEGAAIFSFLINERKDLNSYDYIKLPLIAGLATIKGLKKIENLNYMFKWTNDVYLNKKKLSGILVEKAGSNFIIGIGININNNIPIQVKNTAVSLKEITGITYSLFTVISSVVDSFSKLYDDFEKGKWKEIIEEINHMNYLKNSPTSLKIGDKYIEGIAQYINIDGEIEIFYEGKIHTFSMGEIV